MTRRQNGRGSIHELRPGVLVIRVTEHSTGRRVKRNVARDADHAGQWQETARQHYKRAEHELGRLLVELNGSGPAPTTGPLRVDRGQNLYRVTDVDGVLLYIGLSLQPLQRIAALRSTKHWFPEARCVCIEPLPWGTTRRAALAAEAAAIATEHPRYNVIHAVPGALR